MSGTIVLILFLLAFPALVLWLAERRIALVHKISPVVVCYAAGLAVGNLGILPPSAAAVQENVNTITVVLAIPLLFFSLHIRGLARSGSRALLSFGLQTAAVLVISAAGFLLFHGAFGGEAAKVTGMLIGVYTGGTVNLAAIGTALRVDPSLYVAANASDILFSGLYLLLLMTVGKRLVRLLLRRPAPAYGQPSEPGFVADSSFRGLLSRGVAGPLVAALALAAAIAAAGASLTLVLPGSSGTIAAILAVTTLGIGASYINAVRRIRLTFALGHYFILVFSLSVGTMANLATLISSVPAVGAWVALCIFGSVILHTALAALFGIDADTMIVTSVAGICSPPFVPMIAASLGDRRVIAPGLIAGVVGWIIGTYLGIGVALLLGAAR